MIAQKQAGRYAVAYHPIGGMVPAQKFGEIYAVIKDAANAEVRVAPDETLYIINLEEEQAERIHKITARICLKLRYPASEVPSARSA